MCSLGCGCLPIFCILELANDLISTLLLCVDTALSLFAEYGASLGGYFMTSIVRPSKCESKGEPLAPGCYGFLLSSKSIIWTQTF